MADDFEQLEEAFGRRVIDSLGRVWNPNLHPRDRLGRFVDVGKRILQMPVGTSRSLNDVVDDAPNISVANIFRTPRGWEVRALTRSGPVGFGVTPEQLARNEQAIENGLTGINVMDPFPESPRCPHCGQPSPNGGYLPGHGGLAFEDGDATPDADAIDEPPKTPKRKQPSRVANYFRNVRRGLTDLVTDPETRRDFVDYGRTIAAQERPQGLRDSVRQIRGKRKKIPRVPSGVIRSAVNNAIKSESRRFIYWDDEEQEFVVSQKLRFIGEAGNERGQAILRGTVDEKGYFKSWNHKQGQALRRPPSSEGGEERVLNALFNHRPNEPRTAVATPRTIRDRKPEPPREAADIEDEIADAERVVKEGEDALAVLNADGGDDSPEQAQRRKDIIQDIRRAQKAIKDLKAQQTSGEAPTARVVERPNEEAINSRINELARENEELASAGDEGSLRRKMENDVMIKGLRAQIAPSPQMSNDELFDMAQIVATAEDDRVKEMVSTFTPSIRDQIRAGMPSRKNDADTAAVRDAISARVAPVMDEIEPPAEWEAEVPEDPGVDAPRSPVAGGTARGLEDFFFDRPLEDAQQEELDKSVAKLVDAVEKARNERQRLEAELANATGNSRKAVRRRERITKKLDRAVETHRRLQTELRDLRNIDREAQFLRDFDLGQEFLGVPTDEIENLAEKVKKDGQKRLNDVRNKFNEFYFGLTGRRLDNTQLSKWSLREMAALVDERDQDNTLINQFDGQENPEEFARDFVREAYEAEWRLRALGHMQEVLSDRDRRLKDFKLQQAVERSVAGGKRRGARKWPKGRRKKASAEKLQFVRARQTPVAFVEDQVITVPHGNSDGVWVSNDGFYIAIDFNQRPLDAERLGITGPQKVRLFRKDGKSASWKLETKEATERRRRMSPEEEQQVIADLDALGREIDALQAPEIELLDSDRYNRMPESERQQVLDNLRERLEAENPGRGNRLAAAWEEYYAKDALLKSGWVPVIKRATPEEREAAERRLDEIATELEQYGDDELDSGPGAELLAKWNKINNALERGEVYTDPDNDDRGQTFVIPGKVKSDGRLENRSEQRRGTRVKNGEFISIDGAIEEAKRLAAEDDAKLVKTPEDIGDDEGMLLGDPDYEGTLTDLRDERLGFASLLEDEENKPEGDRDNALIGTLKARVASIDTQIAKYETLILDQLRAERRDLEREFDNVATRNAEVTRGGQSRAVITERLRDLDRQIADLEGEGLNATAIADAIERENELLDDAARLRREIDGLEVQLDAAAPDDPDLYKVRGALLAKRKQLADLGEVAGFNLDLALDGGDDEATKRNVRDTVLPEFLDIDFRRAALQNVFDLAVVPERERIDDLDVVVASAFNAHAVAPENEKQNLFIYRHPDGGFFFSPVHPAWYERARRNPQIDKLNDEEDALQQRYDEIAEKINDRNLSDDERNALNNERSSLITKITEVRDKRSKLMGDRPRVIAMVDDAHHAYVYGLNDAELRDNARLINNMGGVNRLENEREVIAELRDDMPDGLKRFDVALRDYVPREIATSGEPQRIASRATVTTHRQGGDPDPDLGPDLNASLEFYEGHIKWLESERERVLNAALTDVAEKRELDAVEQKMADAQRRLAEIKRQIRERDGFNADGRTELERRAQIGDNARKAIADAMVLQQDTKRTVQVYMDEDGTFSTSTGKYDSTRNRVATVTGGKGGVSPTANWKNDEIKELHDGADNALQQRLADLFYRLPEEEGDDGKVMRLQSKFVIRNFRGAENNDGPNNLRNFDPAVYEIRKLENGKYRVTASPEFDEAPVPLGDFTEEAAALRAVHEIEIDAVGMSGSRAFRLPEEDELAKWVVKNNRLGARPKREGANEAFVIDRRVFEDAEGNFVARFQVARLMPGGDREGTEHRLHDNLIDAKRDVDERLRGGSPPDPQIEWTGDGDKIVGSTTYKGFKKQYEVGRTEDGRYVFDGVLYDSPDDARLAAERQEFNRRVNLDAFRRKEIPSQIVGTPKPDVNPDELEMQRLADSTFGRGPQPKPEPDAPGSVQQRIDERPVRPKNASRAMNTGTTRGRSTPAGASGDPERARQALAAGAVENGILVKRGGRAIASPELQALFTDADWQKIDDIMEGRAGVPMVFWDIETTGLLGFEGPEGAKDMHGGPMGKGELDRPIQIAAFVVVDGEVVGEFNKWMNPDQALGNWVKENVPLDEADRKRLGKEFVDDDFLKEQPPLQDVLKEFQDWLGGFGDVAMVAHNNGGMEYPLMGRLRKMGMIEKDFPPNVIGQIDTMGIARAILGGLPDDEVPWAKYKKGPNKGKPYRTYAEAAIAEFFGIPHKAHNADEDARVMQKIARRLLDGALDRNDRRPDELDSNAESVDAAIEARVRSDKPITGEDIEKSFNMPEGEVDGPAEPEEAIEGVPQLKVGDIHNGQKIKNIIRRDDGRVEIEYERGSRPAPRKSGFDVEAAIKRLEKLEARREELAVAGDIDEVEAIDKAIDNLRQKIEKPTENREKRGEEILPGQGMGKIGGRFRSEIPDENSPEYVDHIMNQGDPEDVGFRATTEDRDYDPLYGDDEQASPGGLAMLGSMSDDSYRAVQASPNMAPTIDALDRMANSDLEGFESVPDVNVLNDQIRNLLENGKYGDEINLDGTLDFNNFIDVKGAVLRKDNGYVSLVMTRLDGSKVSEYTKQRPTPNGYFPWLQRAVAYHGNMETPRGLRADELKSVMDDIQKGDGVDGPAAHYLANLGYQVQENLQRRMGVPPSRRNIDGFIGLRRNNPELLGYTDVDADGTPHVTIHADAMVKKDPVAIALHENLHLMSPAIENPNQLIADGLLGHEEGLVHAYSIHLLPDVAGQMGYDVDAYRASGDNSPYRPWAMAYEGLRHHTGLSPDDFYGQLLQIIPRERENAILEMIRSHKKWNGLGPHLQRASFEAPQIRKFLDILGQKPMRDNHKNGYWIDGLEEPKGYEGIPFWSTINFSYSGFVGSRFD